MSDAITKALSRKIALKFARAALRSGSTSELKKALASLPPNGEKAAALRLRIEEALREKGELNVDKGIQCAAKVACISDGVGYEFSTTEFGSVAFFQARRTGSIVKIIINTAHPFGRQIEESGRISDPVFLAMLASWAHYELDQSSNQRRSVVEAMREDWSRILRRLLSMGEGFGPQATM
jgi:hypothetical protein